ncbi:UDP-3-O-[3-hydroxymyristoyl] N-acetylglucosamine deacetylase [Paramagnetospirillum marisnigri]|uniref:UDP-3-O-acyl-N-acetylglucosamine deacetylase n=1 Tax=Paramagnetospirillum marisnigri TaxID=1285242 RepID=A0A178MUC1_9PROT|nr:UDP-3-O-acyl-N-acetylglucosamine deacetylase [Paramagnetospirillum marisnigri]OAN52417.1 UDP-3-O-[3-hydroxymyristoyl] N-acetylglucosamine deacetylase [Paramagnetospirillum marisnigri]
MRSRTLKTAIGCTGVGLHSGAKVTMVLHPAEAGTGIRFRRVDIAGAGAIVPAHWSAVHDTRMNSCLRNDDGVVVGTVEHLMSALAGMGIDDCLIEINGPEVPVMDGSAAPFLFLIECAGVVEQATPRQAIKVLKRVTVKDGDRMASLTPSSGFSIRFEIDFGATAISRQEFFVNLSRGSFKSEISRARTFGFEQEVAYLRANGLARGGSLDNAVVIDSTGTRVLNDDGLRYGDEFVRHKVLDAVGDLYLAGAPILGHFHGVRSGHALNNQLLRALFADQTAWTFATIQPGSAAAPFAAQPQRAALSA